MKKVAFLIGLGVGFILGSRAGSGPYKRLEEKARSLRERPDVDDAVTRAKEAASEQVTEAVGKVNEKLPAKEATV
ncbi:MAG TPA: hypothetical protein VMF35_05410 [Acidimicrobiales bacterium]|jgi:hypothetical protein|nr:hypothetical protein [Acidimicrobiales bacterium]